MPYRGLMPRDTLTREQIVSAAIELLDADGRTGNAQPGRRLRREPGERLIRHDDPLSPIPTCILFKFTP